MSDINEKKRIAKARQLSNGTVVYTKPVRYPDYIVKALKKLRYEEDLPSISEAIFYCLSNHKSEANVDKKALYRLKTSSTSITVRFREEQCEYIDYICKQRGLNTFSKGVVSILYEYLAYSNRLLDESKEV